MRQRSVFGTVLVAVVVAATAGSVRADDAADAKASASLVKAFSTLCVQSIFDLDRLEQSAGVLGWKKLTGAEAKSFATPAPDAKTTTWLVSGAADLPFWLSITRGTEDGKPVSACTIINSVAPWPPTKIAMMDQLDVKHPFREETEGDQIFTHWQTKIAGTWVILSLSHTASPASPGINMSATLIAKRPFY